MKERDDTMAYMRLLMTTLVTGGLLCVTSTTFAANIFIEPSAGSYGRGDSFTASVRIDPQGECVNAFDIRVAYPRSMISAEAISRGSSIITLWIEEPRVYDTVTSVQDFGIPADEAEQTGVIHLVGGIPGGYCGRIPGDPGLSNTVADIIFRVPGFFVGGADLSPIGDIRFLDGSEVLLNDGLGTPARLIAFDGQFEIATDRTGANEWFDSLQDDRIPPEPFTIQLTQNPSVFDGDYYIVFSTVDKQSGLDHYEVYETDSGNDGFTRAGEPAEWTRQTSPYRLTDQSLKSIIRVRAYDKAGNQRFAAIVPDREIENGRGAIGETPAREPFSTRQIVVAVIFLVLVIIVGRYLRRRKRRVRIKKS